MFGGAHDTGNPGGRKHFSAVGDFQRDGIPNAEHGFVVLERAIAYQQADQIALVFTVRAAPCLHGAMIVQHDLIVAAQFTRFYPFRFTCMACHAGNTQHRMVGGQPQGMSFGSFQAHHRFGAGEEEALRFGREGLAVDQRGEWFADQVAHLACAQSGHHPCIGSDAGIGRFDHLTIRQVVVPAHQFDEQHTRFGMVVSALHDLLPQVGSLHLAIYPFAVGTFGSALRLARGVGFCAVHQLERLVVFQRVHQASVTPTEMLKLRRSPWSWRG